jgi:myosin-7
MKNEKNPEQKLLKFDIKVSTLNTSQSTDVRDAFAKGIYGHLFVHIVQKINSAILRQENSGVISNKEKCAIGVLDIFGFENFDSNSFEQVKIIKNYFFNFFCKLPF